MSSVSSGGKVVGLTPVAQVRSALLEATYVTLLLELLLKRRRKLWRGYVINLGLALEQGSRDLRFELGLLHTSPLHDGSIRQDELHVIAGGGRQFGYLWAQIIWQGTEHTHRCHQPESIA